MYKYDYEIFQEILDEIRKRVNEGEKYICNILTHVMCVGCAREYHDFPVHFNSAAFRYCAEQMLNVCENWFDGYSAEEFLVDNGVRFSDVMNEKNMIVYRNRILDELEKIYCRRFT